MLPMFPLPEHVTTFCFVAWKIRPTSLRLFSGCTLSQLADFYEDKKLTMKQFLVVLSMGYVLDVIPELLEVRRSFEGGGGRG